MTNQGRKFLAGQVQKLRHSLERLLKVHEDLGMMHSQLNDELKKLQDEKALLTDQSFFKAFKQFIQIRRKYRK